MVLAEDSRWRSDTAASIHTAGQPADIASRVSFPICDIVLTRRSWIREFMACQGQVVLANYLSNLTNKRNRAGYDADMELEVLKCFKLSLNVKVSRHFIANC
jgi:hypothetical protein